MLRRWHLFVGDVRIQSHGCSSGMEPSFASVQQVPSWWNTKQHRACPKHGTSNYKCSVCLEMIRGAYIQRCNESFQGLQLKTTKMRIRPWSIDAMKQKGRNCRMRMGLPYWHQQMCVAIGLGLWINNEGIWDGLEVVFPDPFFGRTSLVGYF